MISTKGRYALRVMIDLAEHSDDKLIPLKDIAERQGISKKYLEIIMRDLVRARLVSGVSGKRGGYSLVRAPEDYRIIEILEATEGSLASVACLRKDADPCPRKDVCTTVSMWQEFDSMINDFFSGKTLADLT